MHIAAKHTKIEKIQTNNLKEFEKIQGNIPAFESRQGKKSGILYIYDNTMSRLKTAEKKSILIVEKTMNKL